MNFSFVHNWLKALKAQPSGSIDLPNGVNVHVEVKISAFHAHIKSGKTVAHMLGIDVPTKVQLDYLIKDNRFKLEIVGPVPSKDGAGNDDGDDSSGGMENDDDSEGGNSEYGTEGYDWLHRNLPPDCYQDYDWETVVTAAMARENARQGLVCVSNCNFLFTLW